MNFHILVFVLFLCIVKINSVNILCLMGVPSPSHHIWNRALMNAVAARGHNLTVLSPDQEKNPQSNVHYIHLDNVYDSLYNGSESLNLMKMASETPIKGVFSYYDFCLLTCKGILKSKKSIDTLLNYPKNFKFDLVIFDATAGPCLLGLLKQFNYPPMVSVSAFNIPPFTSDLVGGHKPYAYVPYNNLNYDVNMNIWQRFYNTFLYGLDSIYRNYIVLPEMDTVMKSIFGPDILKGTDLEKLTKIMLVNSDVSIDYPESIPPNMIRVGGLQILDPQPLPKEINDFIEKSKKGAVLFSLGSNMRSDMLDKNKILMFIEAFKQMPQYNFIWKFESEIPLKPSKNVMINAWLAQNDILSHPKIKGFITHAGLLSTHEASWHGVPMIGIPFFVDQHRNIMKSISAGVAEKIDIQTLTTENIRNTILKVLETPSYQENMKLRSSRFKDQPEKPLDRAVWWIEWLLRNPNPTHIRSPTLDLGFIRSNLYDLFFILLFGIFSIVLLVKRLISKLKGDSKDKFTKIKKNQ